MLSLDTNLAGELATTCKERKSKEDRAVRVGLLLGKLECRDRLQTGHEGGRTGETSVFEEEEARREKVRNQKAGTLEPSVWAGGARTPSRVSPRTPRRLGGLRGVGGATLA